MLRVAMMSSIHLGVVYGVKPGLGGYLFSLIFRRLFFLFGPAWYCMENTKLLCCCVMLALHACRLASGPCVFLHGLLCILNCIHT